MKTFYPNNSRFNKAALILATYAPDTIEDIVSLILSQGYSISNVLNAADGPPRPNAVLSRAYLEDSDFPMVFLGLLTVQLSNLRTLEADQDFYERVLEGAFSMPSSMSQAIAKRIETEDVLGGLPEKDARAFYDKMYDATAEIIRESVNYVPALFRIPVENDQDQQYDIDRLYEFKSLGREVDELASRARLMSGQSIIAKSLGLFVTKASAAGLGAVGSGDVDDPDEAGDVITAHEVIEDAVRPLMGDPFSNKMLGGYSSLGVVARAAAKANAHHVVAKAGMGHHSKTKGGKVLKNFSSAVKQIIEKHPSLPKLALATAGVTTGLALLKHMKNKQAMGDLTSESYGDILDQYGPNMAAAYMRGDIAAIMNEAGDLSGEVETTGDPILDEAIIGDVLREIEEEHGDIEAEQPEVGGLIKRMRINHAIKQGKRRINRTKKRVAKQRGKDMESQNLSRAIRYRNSRNTTMASMLPDSSDDQDQDQFFQDQGFDPNQDPEFDPDNADQAGTFFQDPESD